MFVLIGGTPGMLGTVWAWAVDTKLANANTAVATRNALTLRCVFIRDLLLHFSILCVEANAVIQREASPIFHLLCLLILEKAESKVAEKPPTTRK